MSKRHTPPNRMATRRTRANRPLTDAERVEFPTADPPEPAVDPAATPVFFNDTVMRLIDEKPVVTPH